MNTPYVCTQCGQTFRVGEGAGVALDCLACGGLSLPQAVDASPAGYAEEVDPGLRVHFAQAVPPGSSGRNDDEEDDEVEEGEDLHKLPTAILDQATEVLRVPEDALSLAHLPHASEAPEDSYLFSWPGEEADDAVGEDEHHDHDGVDLPHATAVALAVPGRDEREDETSDLDEDASGDDAFAGHSEDVPSSPSLPASLFQHIGEATPGPRPVPPVSLGHGLPLRERSSPGLHLALSAEAREMAGVAHEDTAPAAVPPPARRVVPLGPVAPTDPPVAAAVDPSPPAPPRVARESSTTQRVARAPQPARSSRPRALGAAALASVLAGLLWGLATGGPEVPRSATARGRAEEQMSQGNRAFAESRYDDALAHYRESWVQDRGYAPALRARAVTLARLQRHGEAAAAYRQYLESEPAAADAPEVREVLTRFGGGGIVSP